MVLIIQNTGDSFASSLSAYLSLAGYQPVVVTADEILTCKSFSFRMEEGACRSRFLLRRGLDIDSLNVTVVINLVHRLPQDFIRAFRKEDSDYVYQEWRAIYIAWMKSLQEKILFNPATPTSLSGIEYTRQEWMKMAVDCGLFVPLFEQDSLNGVLSPWEDSLKWPLISATCYDSQIFTPVNLYELPEPVYRSCLRLQEQSGIPLLSIQLSFRNGQWYFLDAGPGIPILSGTSGLFKRIAANVGLRLKASNMLHPQT